MGIFSKSYQDLHRSAEYMPSTGISLIYDCFALLLFPNLCVPFFPFIFRDENPFISAVLAASVLFENRFLPPKPNLSSFFCFLFGGALRPEPSLVGLEERSSFVASSRATSKRSSSFVAPAVVSVFLRSRIQRVSTIFPHHYERNFKRKTYSSSTN